MKGYIAVLAIALILAVGVICGLAGFAMGKVQAREELFKKAHRQWSMRGAGPESMKDDDCKLMSKADRLMRFREFERKHPKQYRQAMDSRRAQVRERLAKLKEEDPEKFDEIMKRLDNLDRTLEDMKKELEAPKSK
jgi:mevalonate kinase